MDHAPKRRHRVIRIDVGPRTVLWTLVTIASAWLFVQLWPVLMILAVALMIVGTLRPIVGALERRGIRRGLGLLIIFLASAIVFALLLFLTVPSLIDQIGAMVEQAPAARDQLVLWLQDHKVTAPLADLVGRIGSAESTAGAGEQVVAISSQVAKVIGYAVTAVFLAIYILIDGKRAQGALFAVVPRDYHLRLARILLNLETIVGGYIRGQLITSAAIAVFTFGLLAVFQVPNALALAVFAGLTDVIPFVGGIIAMTPAVLAALPQGAGVAIAILVIMIVYQEFESRILVPRVYGRVLRLSAATVIVALLIGGMLLGVLGALLALPVAAALQMIVREMRVEMPGDDTDDQELRRRDEHAEAAYERLSAGAPAQDAAVIASKLAQQIRAADAAAEGSDDKAASVPITGGDG
ncbi:MAG TPA: AI-2E family transporter [Kofleriaceae bacterium]